MVLLGSCVSMQDREMTVQERSQMEVIGTVEVEFNSFQFIHIPSRRNITNKAYTELRREAQRQYGGDVDIRNVHISGSGSWWQALITGGGIGIGLIATFATGYYEEEQVMRNNQWVLEETDRYIPAWYIGLPLAIGTNAVGNVQKITATGDVVRGSGSAGVRSQGRPVQQGLTEAVTRAAEVLIQDMPRDTTIAVLNINSRDFSIAEYVIDELEYLIVRSRQFRMVDRNRLEQIRREQNFQMSGEVSDTSAVSIDNLLGANIVVTGDIRENRLVLRVLDVQTAQIITMAREQL